MIKKRVLIVLGSSMCNAGVPNVIMTLVRKLNARYTFDVLTLSEEIGVYDDELRSYGGEIFYQRVINYTEHKLLYPYRFAQIKRAVKQLLCNQKYDIIHCHCGLDSGVCLTAARKAGIRCRIAHAHGNYARSGKNLILRATNWICKKQIVRNATACLACSNLAGQTLYPNAKFINVLNPVDVDYYRDIKKESHSGIQLLQIGYYNSNKNQLFSLRLLQKLRGQGMDARIAFIGFVQVPGYYDRLKAYAENNGLNTYTEFLPSNADKRAAFGRADYLLLPSSSEGLGLVALESQAAGVMCLASTNVPKDVDFGGVTFLPYNDIDAWANFIISNQFDMDKLMQFELSAVTTEAFVNRIEAQYEQ